MRTIECVMDSHSKANRGRSQSFKPRFPEVWNPTPSCVKAGFRDRLYEGNNHTAEASTPTTMHSVGGTLFHPPRFALLFLFAEPANSWMVGITGHLCPISGCAQFAHFCEDLGEAVGESVEARARSALW